MSAPLRKPYRCGNWHTGAWASYLLADAAEGVLRFCQHRAKNSAPAEVPG